MDALNIMGREKNVEKAILEALHKTHRTLQQNFWRVMLNVIKEYSTFNSDLRNEGAVNTCKFLTEQLKNNPDKQYLPFI